MSGKTEEMKYVITAKDAFSAIHKKADAAVDRSAKIFVTSAAGIVTASTAVTGALFAMSHTTATSGDELQKMSGRLSISAQALSEYKHGLELSGTAIDDFEKGIRRLAKNALDAENGLATSKRSFDALGISIHNSNGQLKDSDTLFMEVVAGLNNVESETRQLALTQDLLGKSGANLLPFIRSGKDGIKDMREEARNLSITYTDLEANQSAAFVDAELRIKRSVIGVKNELSKNLIPYFTTAMDTLSGSVMDFKKTGDLDKWAADTADVVIVAFSEVAKTVVQLPMAWNAANVAIKTGSAGVVAALDTMMIPLEEFYGLLSHLPGTIGQPYQQAKNDISSFRSSLSDIGTDLLVSADASEQAGEELGVWAGKAMSAIDAVANKSRSGSTSVTDPSTPGATTATDSIDTTPEHFTTATKDMYGPALGDYQKYLNDKIVAHEQAQSQIRANETDTFNSTRIGLDNNLASIRQYHQDVLQQALINGATESELNGIKAQQAMNLAKAERDYKLAMAGNYMQSAAGFMHNLYVATGKHNKDMFKAYQGFAIGQAVMNTYTGATRAYAQYGWPYGAIAAALVIAQGMAQVAQIRAQTPDGGSSSSAVSPSGETDFSDTVFGDTDTSSLLGSGNDDDDKKHALTINITHNSTVADRDQMARFYEEDLLPIMQEAADRDVVINLGDE